MKSLQTIGILGSGAWATALAMTAYRAGKQALLIARNKYVVDEINSAHCNSRYLPGMMLDQSIKASTDFSALRQCDGVLLVVPAQHMGHTCAQIIPHILKDIPLIIGSKGVEIKTGLLMHDVVRKAFPHNPIAVLSGPTFADEVAKGLPSAATLAATSLELAKHLCEQIGSPNLRPYASADLVGVALAGALKNVIAIGCGIVIGKGLGENARAALMTRGLREMTRLAVALGGKQETLMGLSGLGDLVLTCGSTQSRNMSLGAAIGRGKKLADILNQRSSVAEGVSTCLAAQALAKQHAVETPIIDAVVSVLHDGADVSQVMHQLLSRPLTTE